MTNNKLVSVTARLTRESLEYIKRTGKLFNIDQSTAFRTLLQKGMEEDRKEKALELYIKGKLTLEGAAKFADIYTGDFLELMREKGIESNVTLEDFKKALEHTKSAIKG